MKVKDFIEVYDDAYLSIETEEAVYTDCSDYAVKAHIDNYYDVPIVLFKEYVQLNPQVLEKEITAITASELDIGMIMIYVLCDDI